MLVPTVWLKEKLFCPSDLRSVMKTYVQSYLFGLGFRVGWGFLVGFLFYFTNCGCCTIYKIFGREITHSL